MMERKGGSCLLKAEDKWLFKCRGQLPAGYAANREVSRQISGLGGYRFLGHSYR